jgi:XTP/dITP diphosphohydrolase
MRIERVVLATKNADKRVEMERVLLASGAVGEIVSDAVWPDVEETEDTLEGNAILKARAAFGATGIAAVADDTGLEVTALGGAPGVRTGRYAGEEASYDDNVEKMLRELEGVEDRSARFRTVIAVVGAGEAPLVVEGHLDGRIARERRGRYGFGYDPIFEVAGRTLGEMSVEEKNAMSHRAEALRALAALLGR